MGMQPDMIASLPIWEAGLLMLAVAIAAAVSVELAARRLIPQELREAHNAVAAAMFTVVGTTYAVLLAFTAMLALEAFNKAQAATDTEASLVVNVHQLVSGLTGPEMPAMTADLLQYVRNVIRTEWPAQAAGRPLPDGEPSLDHVTRTALHLRPDNLADGNLHALLLDDLTRAHAAGPRVRRRAACMDRPR